MQEINNESQSRRGSSPPFQELERWIEDGASGSHWVKLPTFNPEQAADRTKESPGTEPGV